MLETIMTGNTPPQLAGVDNSFDLMARDPDKIRVFNAAMADITRIVTPAVIRAYDFGKITHLMDVGGGAGELIGAVAAQYPHLSGTILDLPRCAAPAANHLSGLGVGDRVKFLAGDFFKKTIPSIGDAIVMKSIIHDWSDELSLTILGNCCKALPKTGTLLLVERLMPEHPGVDGEHREKALSDLDMLRGPGGRERTEREYVQLLHEAGFVHKADSIRPVDQVSSRRGSVDRDHRNPGSPSRSKRLAVLDQDAMCQARMYRHCIIPAFLPIADPRRTVHCRPTILGCPLRIAAAFETG